MRKLHWVSLALISAPLVLMHACSDDDQPANPTGGSGGSGGSGGATSGGGKAATGGSGGTGGSATGGSAGSAGSAGTGGGSTEGGAGSTTEGGAGSTGSEAGDAPKVDAPVVDAPSDASNKACENDANAMKGKTCSDYCDTFIATCNDDPIFTADGGSKPYASAGDCRSKCNAFLDDQLCCYLVHVDNATKYDGGTRSTHCTHANGSPGNMVCPVRTP